jgi:hypothetical protein
MYIDQHLPALLLRPPMQAGYEAAEKFDLPLAVLAQYPLSQSLLMAGLNSYNYPTNVPLESMPLNISAHAANPLIRYVASPALKCLTSMVSDWAVKAARNRLRKQLGLPRMAQGGFFALQDGVPRSLFICGASWELVSAQLAAAAEESPKLCCQQLRVRMAHIACLDSTRAVHSIVAGAVDVLAVALNTIRVCCCQRVA